MIKNKNSLSTRKAVLIYIMVALFLVFEMAVQVSPSVMAASLMRDLNMSVLALGIMSGVYFYTYTAMQIPSGLLFDRFNAKLIIFSALMICSIGAVTFIFASNFFLGCLARLLMGFGSAFAFVSVLSVAADLFDKKKFALITGITQALAALGAMAGQYPVSFAVTHFGWRTTMFLLALFGFVLALVILKYLNYKKVTVKTVIAANSSVTTNIINDIKVIIKNKQTWFVAFYACLLWAPMSGFASLWGVPFFMHINHFSLSHAAFAISLMWLGLAFGSTALGVLANYFDKRVIFLWISAAMGAIAFFMILKAQLLGFWLYITLFFAGAACAGQALSFAVVRHNNDYSVKSTAIAFNNMAVVISGAVFQPVMGGLIQFFQHQGQQQAYREGCYIIFAAYFVAVVLAVFFIREKNTEANKLC